MSKKLKDDALEIARTLAKPIDFEALEKGGILKRRSRYWYQVVDANRLPDHVWRQATALRNEGTSVSIKLPVSWKRAQKILERIERDLA